MPSVQNDVCGSIFWKKPPKTTYKTMKIMVFQAKSMVLGPTTFYKLYGGGGGGGGGGGMEII